MKAVASLWRGALRALLCGLCVMLSACVSFPDAPAPTVAPMLDETGLVSIDGTRLAVTVWEAEAPQAILIALHGMNDYAETYALAAPWWAREAGITTYALDQRGFGRSPSFGRWPGAEALAADLRAAVKAARLAHPGLPVFVIGHSMGAAVVMKAAGDATPDDPLAADGLILAAPGVWGGPALPLPYRATLNFAAAIIPGKTLTGERAGRQPSDNIEVMRQMYADPLVIKDTRIDSILGVVRLMGEAYREAARVNGDILLLMGEKDEVIPVRAMESVSRRLCGAVEVRRYAEGWHLILRDNQARSVWRDVAAWIAARSGAARAGDNENAAGRLGQSQPAAFQCVSRDSGGIG